MLKGKWNYREPITYTVISYEVTKSEATPMHWQNCLVGERRQGLIVSTVKTEERPNVESFIIDNEHGDGWYKIFSGKGSPGFGHKEVVNPKGVENLPDSEVNVKYDLEAIRKEHEFHDNWCERFYPEEYKKIKALRSGLKKLYADNPEAFKHIK